MNSLSYHFKDKKCSLYSKAERIFLNLKISHNSPSPLPSSLPLKQARRSPRKKSRKHREYVFLPNLTTTSSPLKSHWCYNTQISLHPFFSVIINIILDCLYQLLFCLIFPAIIHFRFMIPQNPSIGSLSIHLPTLDMLWVIPASTIFCRKILEVYWYPLSE